jgi:hypothetical protein
MACHEVFIGEFFGNAVDVTIQRSWWRARWFIIRVLLDSTLYQKPPETGIYREDI